MDTAAPTFLEEAKARARKANAAATTWKMNLHDLSEELPTGWEKILEVAQRCHEAHAELAAARAAVKQAGG
jgi:hypothetical protein